LKVIWKSQQFNTRSSTQDGRTPQIMQKQSN
jgi:hypothetical protein